MGETTRTMQLGAARVLLMNVGDLQFRMQDWYHVTESERAHYPTLFSHPLRCPTQSIYIALSETSVLVDAALYDLAPDSPYLIENYQAPPSLLAQLAEAGVSPEDVKHVVITHGHFDHYTGVTVKRDGKYEPSFPNARYYVGRAEWEDEERQQALQDPDSEQSRTFGVLYQQGLLELVNGNRDLGNDIEIMAAPGETPGHQIVRIQSEGETLYCLGDLYHHTIEIERPEWSVHWADAETIRTSREALTNAALKENARLIATHILTIGRLRRVGTGLQWVTAE